MKQWTELFILLLPVLFLIEACSRGETGDSQAKQEVRMAELKNMTQEERRATRETYDISDEGTLKAGDEAPDFDLLTADGSATIRLSSLRGKSEVALIFGSYT